MKEDHTLHDTATEETPCTESIGKTVSTQQEPSYNAPDISNVIVHLPPIINQPVQFPVYPKQTEEQGDGVEADQSVESESDIPLFFNYHEFQETYYIEAGSIDQGAKEHDQEHALVITHFPNIYASLDSTEWETTRIVRISRAYDKRVNYPCFSEYIPGSEPAAIVNDTTKDKFVCQGKVPRDGQWYGYSSVSPLSLYFTPTQFQEIISKINQLIEEEYKIGSLTNRFRTGGFLSCCIM